MFLAIISFCIVATLRTTNTMKHPPLFCVVAFGFALLALSPCLPAHGAVQTYGTLLSYDFDTTAWPGASTEAVGTIDTASSTQASLGLRSSSLVASPALPISITETNLGKLTLSFSLSASSAKPVTVTIQSYDSSKVRTGGLQILVYPAAPNFYQRYAVDLSTCKPSGTGTFQPNAPYVSFSFSTQDPSWQGVPNPEIRVDNVNYALPAYYVRPSTEGGSNSNTGRSETSAFATPQQALNVAQAGDIIDVMAGNSGTYVYTGGAATATADYGTSSVAAFKRAGTPSKWIVLRNYPGQQPTFETNAWDTVAIEEVNYDPSIPLAYLEVRGLHIRNQGDVAATRYSSYLNSATQTTPHSQTNTNGISVNSSGMTYVPHHIRIADNFVEYCPGGGIGTSGDWIIIEGNVCRYNAFTTQYGQSGISLAGTSNYDGTSNVYRDLIRHNVCYGNQTFYPYKYSSPAYSSLSDGNGIIMDVNFYVGGAAFTGRTLVQSNLCFNNGGAGVHAYRASHVDIINNTAYLNSASPSLQYSEVDAMSGDDCRVYNNILVAPTANLAAGEKPESVNSNYNATNLTWAYNLYYGGNSTPSKGNIDIGNVIRDPKFVNPSRDPSVADFHLQAISPALGTGVTQAFSPYLDLDGRVRNAAAPDKGAYELTTTTTALVSSANPSAFGASITLTATVTGNAPTGTVTFTDGGTTLGTGTLVNGVATFSTAALALGTHSLKASYAGDTGNTPSTSATVTQSVEGAPTANAQSVTTLSGHDVPITLSGSDPNTPTLPLTYSIASAPAHGSLSGTAPTLTYTPAVGYVGPDSFTFTVSNSYLVSSPATVSLTVTQTTVSGTVTLQGWQGTPQPLTFTLMPTGSTGGSVTTQTLMPGSNGSFSLADVAPGTYMLGIKGSKWLRKSIAVDTTNGSVNGLSLLLLAGDVNNDNQVTSPDYLILRTAFGKTSGQTGYDARADLNGDGQVTSPDYLLLRQNFGKSGN